LCLGSLPVWLAVFEQHAKGDMREGL
jgi:hypothetical protein